MATNKKTGKPHEPVEMTDSAAGSLREHQARQRLSKPKTPAKAAKKTNVRDRMDESKSARQSALKAAQRANRPGKSRKSS